MVSLRALHINDLDLTCQIDEVALWSSDDDNARMAKSNGKSQIPLDIFAYHISVLENEPPGSRFGLYYGGDPHTNHIQVEIRPSTLGDDRRWDQVYFNGESMGNRAGARKAYSQLAWPHIGKPHPG